MTDSPSRSETSPSADGRGTAALLAEIDQLKSRLGEAEDIISAIRQNEVDAVVVGQAEPERVFVFEGADHPYRVLVETMQGGAVTLAIDGTVLYANPSFARMVHAPVEEIVGSPLRQFIAPDGIARFEALLRQPEAGRDEFQLRGTSGAELPVFLSRSAAETFGEGVFVMVVTDLSEQKRQEEIVASERLARAILAQAAGPLIVCDERGRVTHSNQEAESLCGCNPLRRPFHEVLPLLPGAAGEPGSAGADPRDFSRRVALGEVQAEREEVAFTRRDGSIAHLLLSSSPLRGEADRSLGTILVLTDITERNRVLEALSESERRLRALNETLEERVLERSQQVRALASALTMAEQAERMRVATVLHDHLQQMLFALQLKIDLTRNQLHRDTGSLPSDLFAEMEALTNEAIECTRTLTVELSPPVLRGDDLAEMLAWLASHMQERHRLDVDLVVRELGPAVSKSLSLLLFQMARELLFNVAKHAGVPEAHVEVRTQDDLVVIRVEDDGTGFDVEEQSNRQATGTGFGLKYISERLEVLGGRLEVDSAPGQGTCTTIVVPLRVETAWKNRAPVGEGMLPPSGRAVGSTAGAAD